MQRESGLLVDRRVCCCCRPSHAYRFDVLQGALLAILKPQELIGVLSLDELVHGWRMCLCSAVVRLTALSEDAGGCDQNKTFVLGWFLFSGEGWWLS